MTQDTHEPPAFSAMSGSSGISELPHNHEMEQAVLGALLVNNDASGRISDFLLKEHFFETAHQRIYEAINKLIDRSQLANPVTLKHFFEQDQTLSQVGGAQYLAQLAGAAVTVYNVEQYARAVHDLALRRSLIDISDQMSHDAVKIDVDDPAVEQIERAEQNLYNLAETGLREGGFREFRLALKDAIELAAAAHKRDSRLSGLSTGLIGLDETLGGMHRSDLIVLAARPAMGKTALATNIAYHNASNYRAKLDKHGNLEIEDGAIVGFFSLEMSAEQLATRLLSEQAQVPSDKIRRGMISNLDFDNIVLSSQKLSELPLYIDDTPALSISALRTRARRLKRTKGLGLIVVDYLQLIRPSNRTRYENRVQEISEITQSLKAIAKELNVPVLALSQLSRQVENRDDNRPQLSDLRESGTIEQDSDVVLFLFREEYYHSRREPEPDTAKHAEWVEKAERIHGVAEVIVGKQRHGPTGTVKLQFEKQFTKFNNLDLNDHLPDAV